MNIKAIKQGPVRVIAVASGKGGVGKTNISINLSMAMADLGREVILFDADLGLANVDVLLGVSSIALRFAVRVVAADRSRPSEVPSSRAVTSSLTRRMRTTDSLASLTLSRMRIERSNCASRSAWVMSV